MSRANYARGADRMMRSRETVLPDYIDDREPWQKQRDARRAARKFPAWMKDPTKLPKAPPGRP